MRKWLVLSTIALIPTLLAGAEAQSAESLDANVQYTIDVIDLGPDGEAGRRSAKVLAREGARTQLLTGWRVPIPTVSWNSANADGGGVTPLTSYSYQDIGLQASLEGRLDGESRIRLSGRIEVSRVDRDAAAPPDGSDLPKVATFSHNFEVILSNGVETTLAEVPKPEGGSMRLELTAESGK